MSYPPLSHRPKWTAMHNRFSGCLLDVGTGSGLEGEDLSQTFPIFQCNQRLFNPIILIIFRKSSLAWTIGIRQLDQLVTVDDTHELSPFVSSKLNWIPWPGGDQGAGTKRLGPQSKITEIPGRAVWIASCNRTPLGEVGWVPPNG